MAGSYGFIPSKKDLRNYKLNKKSICNISLPDEFSVRHSDIKNQGKVCSCVPHAVTEIFEAAIPSCKFSTDWIYGYRPFGYFQGAGMTISNALKTVTKQGAVLKQDLASNTEMPKVKEIVNKNIDKYKWLASENKAIKYARVFSVKKLKEAIYTTGLPAIVAINIDDDGLKLDKNNIAYVPDKEDGGHAVVCYGWNEMGLLIQNSWGKTWGDNGTFILPAEYQPAEMWVLSFDENSLAKPKTYWLADFIMNILNAIKNLFKH